MNILQFWKKFHTFIELAILISVLRALYSNLWRGSLRRFSSFGRWGGRDDATCPRYRDILRQQLADSYCVGVLNLSIENRAIDCGDNFLEAGPRQGSPTKEIRL